MSKYITHFQTEAEYQSALPNLDLPNVSLVDELGEVHYHRALYGAHAGDIALYDVANAQKIVVTAEDWNLTDYPTASYPIIGIAIADENATGVTLCSALAMAADGSTSTTETALKWQNTQFDWGLTKYSTENNAKTDFNGKTNTATIIAAIKAYDLSHSTDNLTGNLSGAIQAFTVAGTSAGDWYVGAAGELYTLGVNFTTIDSTITRIKTFDNSLATKIGLNSVNPILLSSTEYSDSYPWFLYRPNNSQIGLIHDWSKDTAFITRPLLKLT